MLYETERLIIRQWKTKDAKDLFEYVSQDEVTKFLTFPTYTNLDQAYERINFLQGEYASKAVCSDYAIELKLEKKVIGSIGIVKYKTKAEGILEIGYILNPLYQHQGFMNEAVKGMFKYVKQNGLAKRIYAKHDIDNEASGNVMKKAGMTFEGVLRKSDKNNNADRIDCAVYSILFEEI